MTTNRLRKWHQRKSEWLVFVDRDEQEIHRVSTDGVKPEAIFRKDSFVFFRLPGGRQLFTASCIKPRLGVGVEVTLVPISDGEALGKSLKKAKP